METQSGENKLDRATYDKFRQLIYDKSGIKLGDQKEALVSSRIGKRMRELGITDPREYLQWVLNDDSGQELVQLLDVISTNVTSFYREPQHFDLLDSLLRKWWSEGQRKFRIWSAASSTGEEPYTIAVVVMEALGTQASDVKILATDISTRVLEQCRRGEYDRNRVEGVPFMLRDKYFDAVRDDYGAVYRVKDRLKSMMSFRRLNLSTPPFPMRGPLDVIFCRNVMIYFDNQVRARLLEDMYRLLKPGGFLMVGHSESLTGLVSRFKPVRPSVYTK